MPVLKQLNCQGLNALFSGGSLMEMMKYGVLGIFAMSVSVALMNYNDDGEEFKI